MQVLVSSLPVDSERPKRAQTGVADRFTPDLRRCHGCLSQGRPLKMWVIDIQICYEHRQNPTKSGETNWTNHARETSQTTATLLDCLKNIVMYTSDHVWYSCRCRSSASEGKDVFCSPTDTVFRGTGDDWQFFATYPLCNMGNLDHGLLYSVCNRLA